MPTMGDWTRRAAGKSQREPQVSHGLLRQARANLLRLQFMQRLPSITRDTALFLDFDGTLADLAPAPDAVRVEHGLVSTLAALYEALEGALAIVSGRRLCDIDHFLAPLHLPAAFEHGSQLRRPDGSLISLAAPDLAEALAAAQALARRHPGLLVEPKLASVALHYRHAPELESQCRKALAEVVTRSPALELTTGKCVLEVKQAGVDKGRAIELFMAEAPFAGRQPLFAGDDVTDEAGFAAVRRLGGLAVKVGTGPSGAQFECDSPQALRAWLQFSTRRVGTAPATRRQA